MKYFKRQLVYIQDPEIRDFTIKVLEKVNEKFFTAPASSSGKYHPDFALGESGLYRHTVAAVEIAYDLLQRTPPIICLDNDVPLKQYVKDSIISALILHDTCKSGVSWDSDSTKHEHPIYAGALIRSTNFELYSEVKLYARTIAEAVETHMGEWTTNKYSATVLSSPATHVQKFVHMCDYLASRKYMGFNPEWIAD